MTIELLWSAWRNGTGTSVGLKVPIQDRQTYFDPSWSTVFLIFPVETGYGEVEVNIDRPSFWNDTCHELINEHIKNWLSSLGLVPWIKGHPPKVIIESLGKGRFAIRGVKDLRELLDDQREQAAILRHSMKQAAKVAKENPY